ncbi:MAG: hypothetical protein ACHQRM_16930 [Bacteroidia bacterium]
MLNIHDICIRNSQQEIIWKWDKYTLEFKRNLLLLQSEDLWPGKLIHLSTWLDPHFFVSTNEEVQNQSHLGITVEVTLSAVSEAQLALLNDLTTPFTSISEQQYRGSLQQSEHLLAEKNGLQTELAASRMAYHQAQELNTQIKQTIKSNEALTGQLLKDKEFLQAEIGIKNELLQKSAAEKEKSDILLSTHAGIIEQLQQELRTRDSRILELTGMIHTLETTLLTRENTIKELTEDARRQSQYLLELKAEKEVIENKRMKLEALLQDHQSQIEKLKEENKNQDRQIRQAGLEKETLSKQLTEKETGIQAEKKNSAELQKALDTLSLEKSSLETAFYAEKNKTIQLNQDKTRLTEKLHGETANAARLSEQLVTLNEDIDGMKKKGNELFSLNKEKEAELNLAAQQIASLTQTVALQQRTLTDYEEKYIKSSLFQLLMLKLKSK